MMEPPYAERHVRWCERTHGELIPMLLLDIYCKKKIFLICFSRLVLSSLCLPACESGEVFFRRIWDIRTN